MILALDTSSAASAALVELPAGASPDDASAVRMHAARTVFGARRHAEVLAPFVDEIVDEAGLNGPPDAVAVGVGPGPYTGLRVGIASAFGYALGWDVPVHGVLSLDALALQTAGRTGGGDDAGRDIVTATDARRREVYWARYAGTDPAQLPQRVAGPSVDRPADVADAFRHGDPIRAGKGFALYPEILGTPVSDLPELMEPVAAAVGAVALRRLAAGLTLPEPEPEYLRRPDAAAPGAPKRVLR
nr:tRNA (adenosine(37)-N6)-threonylcarbamoyltransferase complex dimerization subunit type 1 TsaB [Spelaeicoccus albus]